MIIGMGGGIPNINEAKSVLDICFTNILLFRLLSFKLLQYEGNLSSPCVNNDMVYMKMVASRVKTLKIWTGKK